jgi:subtilisin family serine protease
MCTIGTPKRSTCSWLEPLLHVDIAAPSVINVLESSAPVGFSKAVGNSFAGPLVSGAVGLMLSKDDTLRGKPDVLKSRLLCNANKKTSFANVVKDGNTLDAYAAVMNEKGCP